MDRYREITENIVGQGQIVQIVRFKNENENKKNLIT